MFIPISPIRVVWWHKKDAKWHRSSFQCSLSLCFNGHFPGEPGLADVYWSKGWWRWWWQLDYWSYKSCKTPVKSSPPTNQHPVFLQARCPSCRPTNSVKALKGKISHSMDLLSTSSPGGLPTLSLTTNSSWLPWGGMPCLSSALWCQYPYLLNAVKDRYILTVCQPVKYSLFSGMNYLDQMLFLLLLITCSGDCGNVLAYYYKY